MNRSRLLFSTLLAAVCAPLTASAQAPAPAAPASAPATTSYVTASKVARAADKPEGLSYNVKLAANLNIASNRDVVGQVNGNSFLFGASVLSGLGYLSGPHEWMATGTLTETWSKTPAIDRFLKSNDLLDLQSVYNYFLTDFTGPFARVSAQTSLLPTNRITATQVGYDDEGTTEDESATQRKTVFKLSDGFQPFTLTESLGWFLQPLHSERISAFGRVGVGGRHTWADGARAITSGTPTDANVKYTVLNDVHQAGAELFVGADGKEVDGKLVYTVGLSSLFPVINNDKGDPVTGESRSILKLTKVALTAQAGINVVSWMGVNYQLKVIRDVQLVDAVQVQNSLLLSFQYGLSSHAPVVAAAPLSPEVVARLEDCETRVKNAEMRATEAEARAAAAAPALPAMPVAPAAPEAPAAVIPAVPAASVVVPAPAVAAPAVAVPAAPAMAAPAVAVPAVAAPAAPAVVVPAAPAAAAAAVKPAVVKPAALKPAAKPVAAAVKPAAAVAVPAAATPATR
jgi:hypothetical protein